MVCSGKDKQAEDKSPALSVSPGYYSIRIFRFSGNNFSPRLHLLESKRNSALLLQGAEMVEAERFELPPYRLKAGCSATELYFQTSGADPRKRRIHLCKLIQVLVYHAINSITSLPLDLILHFKDTLKNIPPLTGWPEAGYKKGVKNENPCTRYLYF